MAANDRAVGGTAALRRLVDRARAEPEAFAALYDQFVDRVYGFAYRRLGSRAEAEDVTSETFLKALSNLDRFRWQAGGFEAWLLRIARNLCLDQLRSRSRMVADSPGASPAEQAATDPGPEQVVVQAESAARLQSLVSQLPEAQREAVLLKYTAGLSNQEVAAVTGRSPTAVSSLLNRATTRLRERFGNHVS
jgi:RNA polymerase sigma-70 factor, ECF subfamily